MNLFQALVLGIVQGATEYIPVSSSAHLVLIPWLLGWPDASFAFEVLIQLGTLVGVFVYFWEILVAGVCSYLEFLLFQKIVPVDICVTIPIILPNHNIAIDCWPHLIFFISGNLEFCSGFKIVPVDICVTISIVFPDHNIAIDCWENLIVWICSDLELLRMYTRGNE